MSRLAFLGPHASFAEQALATLSAAAAELLPCAGTTATLAAVREGRADAACVPIENSVEGSVGATLDGLVEDPPLVITAEVLLPVRFAVLVRPGTAADEVRTVASHPHGEAQTRRWLAANLPAAQVLMSTSTAEAAAQVSRGEVDAAVCAPVAARRYGLDVLAMDVGDNADAVTRFVLAGPPGPPPPATGVDRTSLAATTVNRPGALLGVLTELAVRGIDLTRIESRPTKDRLGEYRFFLDCAGHVADAAMGEALAALHRRCTQVRYLGSYPRADLPGALVPPPDERFADAVAWLAAVRAGRDA